MIASDGDYIIRGINGEFYPCKPDIFEKLICQIQILKTISIVFVILQTIEMLRGTHIEADKILCEVLKNSWAK